jgi:pimeloyl-ACP methyl ester carboxylesterase
MPAIILDGAKIAYEEKGKGEPAILLHGWNSSRKQWLLNLKALGSRFRAIALDLPGFGESEESAYPYTLEGMSSFLDAFRSALHLPSFHLMGHSMGGCIAVRYTALNPDRVNRLVLVSTPTRTLSMGPWALVPGAGLFVSSTYRLRSETLLKWMFYRGLYKPRQQDLDFMRANVKANALAARRALSASTRLVRKLDLADDLHCIGQPALIVFGDKDRSVNPGDALRQRELLSNPYMTILTACGHCPPYERPDLFNTVVLDFLQEEGLERRGGDERSLRYE